MRCRLLVGCIIALPLIGAALPASGQAVYAARQEHPRLAVGAGFSASGQDWGPHLVIGTTGWLDWRPGFFNGPLNGLGIEIMGRDLSGNRGTAVQRGGQVVPIKPRTDTIGGGLIYHVQQKGFYRFEPYVKAIGSYGSIDFTLGNPRSSYSHDTRTVLSLGGGLDWNVARHITIRGDYEYQFWPNFLGAQLNPIVFTGGALYRFGYSH